MVQNSRLIGSGRAFPERKMTNHDFESYLETSDHWIKSRTGIESRYIADPKKNESTLSMALEASHKALEMAGLQASDLDGIIVGTITPESVMPCTAVLLQDALKMGSGFGFDLQASCAGFLYALSVADGFIKMGKAKNLLVVGADTLSNIVDWQDRSTCVLFGDGAGAVVLQATTEPEVGIRHVDIYSDGTYREDLKVEHGYSATPPYHPDYSVAKHAIKMNGSEVFKVAVRSMISASERVLRETGLGIEDIDQFFFHQANLRIIDMCQKTMKLPAEKVWINVQKYGNTSAATIPVSIDEALREGVIKKGDKLLMASFGGGFAWGAGLLIL